MAEEVGKIVILGAEVPVGLAEELRVEEAMHGIITELEMASRRKVRDGIAQKMLMT